MHSVGLNAAAVHTMAIDVVAASDTRAAVQSKYASCPLVEPSLLGR